MYMVQASSDLTQACFMMKNQAMCLLGKTRSLILVTAKKSKIEYGDEENIDNKFAAFRLNIKQAMFQSTVNTNSVSFVKFVTL